MLSKHKHFSIYDESKDTVNELDKHIYEINCIKTYIKGCIVKNIAVKEYISVLKELDRTKETLLKEKYWHDRLIFEIEYILKSL